jgi:hypothetical protein
VTCIISNAPLSKETVNVLVAIRECVYAITYYEKNYQINSKKTLCTDDAIAALSIIIIISDAKIPQIYHGMKSKI